MKGKRHISGKFGAFPLDEDKIDDTILALLRLGLHAEHRAWKSFDWDSMERLHEKGFISDPVGKAKSVWLTEEGLENPNSFCISCSGKSPISPERRPKVNRSLFSVGFHTLPQWTPRSADHRHSHGRSQ
ncbi:hypothetical protein MACH17_40770 [Phaeobacter inhibens]|uniref:DUF6429 family protein n=1 Tax=Phaeobacter inhibens TaxID=221822 RepID=UPI0027673072|nr:DUF6429 family protein [Phaeobacter inhibens]GLO72560.1 hypothetical protein MACH17_40770 [Phaeobacter inhibens]